MTAYARAAVSSSIGRVTVEIQSVNRKHFELLLNLPKELSQFEMDIRGWVRDRVTRGRITVTLSVIFEGVSPVKAVPNLPLARQVYSAWQEIGMELGVGAGAPGIEMLQRVEGIMTFETDLADPDAYRSAVKGAVDQALDDFDAMKKVEGSALSDDIGGRITTITDLVEKISVQADNATAKYRERLQTQLEKVLPGAVENDDRILREIAVYADRIDIAEEVTRCRSHLDQMGTLLNGNGVAKGKTLEFMLQELSREWNTIGAKSGDVEVSHNVIQAKSELERIREQVQNVE